EGRRALSTLCRDYWHPIYAFIRRQGHGAEEARDLTQGYFLLLLESTLLRDVRQAQGRFRSYLLASVRHLLSDAREPERAARRRAGAGRFPLVPPPLRPPLPVRRAGPGARRQARRGRLPHPTRRGVRGGE